MRTFGKVLKKYRKRAGLSQSSLGAKLGYDSGQFISNVERGVADIPAKKLKKLSDILATKSFVFKDALVKDYKKHLDSIVK